MARASLLSLYLLFHHLSLPSVGSDPGEVALFLDGECSTPSVINPSVKLAADTCLVTLGAYGISIQELPPCTSGDATLIQYEDTSCANPAGSNAQDNNCYYWASLNGIPAVLFACTDVDRGAFATATSTVSAGSTIIPVAGNTPSPTSSNATTEQSTLSSNGAATTSTSPNPFQTNTDSGTGTGSGLGQKGQIALGIIIPVGGILVALLAWWFPCRKGRNRPPDQYALTHSPSHGLAQSTLGTPPFNATTMQPPVWSHSPGWSHGNDHRGSGFLTGQNLR